MVVGLRDIWELPGWVKLGIFLGSLIALNVPLPVLNISIGISVIKPVLEWVFSLFGISFNYELFVILAFLLPLAFFVLSHGVPTLPVNRARARR